MRISRFLAFFFAVLSGGACAAGPSGLLNDTGQTQCYDAADAAVACDIAGVGSDAGVNPRQDARFGRDAAQAAGTLPAKTGGGAAGFDFTRICWNGSPEGTTGGPNPCTGTLVANTGDTASGTPATDWACTRDNVTGLVWSLQTYVGIDWDTAMDAAFPDAGHNTPARCGLASGWRMPARRELLSLIHYGLSPSIMIDPAYFPDSPGGWHWAAEAAVAFADTAWYVDFGQGTSRPIASAFPLNARLVRSAP